MKKVVYIGIAFVAIIVAFLLGVIIGKSSAGSNKSNVSGVYQTDTWNGKTGTLALYEDGTCQYPSGGNATWELVENTVLITVRNNYDYVDGGTKGMTLHFDAELSEVEIDNTINALYEMDNISGVYWDPSTSLCEITLATAETDGKTAGVISQYNGVSIIEVVLDEEPEASEHEAKIMEDGLMLHGHFFEKVSD